MDFICGIKERITEMVLNLIKKRSKIGKVEK